MDTHLKRLTFITNGELALLNAGGINNMDELGYLKYSDIQSILIGSTTVTWRKIERIALLIDGRETVRTVTKMADITANLQTVGVTSFTASTSTASTHTVDPSRVAPKLHVNALKEFDGQPIKYEDWSEASKRPWDIRLTLHSSRRHPRPATPSWKQGTKISSSCSPVH